MNRMEFLRKIGLFLGYAHKQDIKLICFTFYRSPEDQLKEYNAGRSHVKFGKHQKWLAMDFAIVDDLNFDGVVDKDEIRWGNSPRYLLLGEFWEEIGGFWGGRWTLKDIYHFEG